MKINTEVLKRLAIHLNNLPLDYTHFSMDHYLIKHESMYDPNEANLCELGSCGTVACALGHAPFVDGILKPTTQQFWAEYGYEIVFNDVQNGISETLYSFMFSGHWIYTDNSPKGAAKRIWLVATDNIFVLENFYNFDGRKPNMTDELVKRLTTIEIPSQFVEEV